MTNIATLVRAARKSRGLTQAQLSERSRLDQSRVSRSESRAEDPRFDTVDRLLAGSGHRLYSAPTRRDDAATAAALIRSALDQGKRSEAFRHLIQLSDDLNAEYGLVRGILGVAEPETTGDRLWDAAIAGVVAWRLADEGLPLPSWTNEPGRRITPPQVLRGDAADPDPSPDDVPPAFAERGVLAWRDSFESV